MSNFNVSGEDEIIEYLSGISPKHQARTMSSRNQQNPKLSSPAGVLGGTRYVEGNSTIKKVDVTLDSNPAFWSSLS